jgi:glutaredoxin-like YruB-family protein
MKEIIIYSTPTCVYCDLAKNFFQEKGIKYTDYDVSTDNEKRQEMVEKSGQMGVPVIFIGKEMIIGFDKDKVEEIIDHL